MNLKIGYFARNLHNLRTGSGFTQQELGKLTGYSGKSISKWESSHVLPPANVLLKLAEVLQTDLNTMFSPTEEPEYFLGVDGGGTSTEFVLTDKDNTVIKQCTYGPTNIINLDREQVIKTITQGVAEACCGVPYSKISAFFGVAGAASGKAAMLMSIVNRFGFSKADCGTDAQNAISAGLKGNDGIIAILGTGSVVFSTNHGKLSRFGGYGHLLGDYGSGYEIGKTGIYAVLADTDGSGPETILTKMFEDNYNKTALDMLPDFYQKGKPYIASFAPIVFNAYDSGDRVAKKIITDNVSILSNQIKAAIRLFDKNVKIPVVLSGGLTAFDTVLIPLLNHQIKNPNAEIRVLDEHPVMGAVRLARLSEGESQ